MCVWFPQMLIQKQNPSFLVAEIHLPRKTSLLAQFTPSPPRAVGRWLCIYLSHILFSLGPFTDI